MVPSSLSSLASRFLVFPDRIIRQRFGALPIAIPQEDVEEYPWWSGAQPPKDLEAWISAILPEKTSWSKSMRIWGDERGDTGVVCYGQAQEVEWIGFRIDVRNISPGYVKAICDLSMRLECNLVTAAYQVLEPNYSELLAAI